MSIEEQCLDLCNVKTKSNVDDDHNTTNNTEGVTPRISELMTDSNTEKPNTVPTEASETYLMPQLTDNLQAAEEDNYQSQDTLAIDEVNGNTKCSAQDAPAVVNQTDLIFSNDEQHKDIVGVEEMKDLKDNDTKCVMDKGDDGADMDIGVDLSLDESGVLEAESTNVSSFSDKAQDVPARNSAESPPNMSPTSSTEASATDQAGLYPSVEEGDDKPKPSGKRVKFPSDEDIISGAVEPKDPWRHGNTVCICFCMSVCVNGFLLILLVHSTCMNMLVQHGLSGFILVGLLTLAFFSSSISLKAVHSAKIGFKICLLMVHIPCVVS